MEGGALISEISALVKDTSENSLTLRLPWEGAARTRKHGTTSVTQKRHQIYQHLGLGHAIRRTVEK